MYWHYHPHREQNQPRLAPPLGAVVLCIHCFQTLGTDTAATPRDLLLARHSCIERKLSKEPAAPPPYN